MEYNVGNLVRLKSWDKLNEKEQAGCLSKSEEYIRSLMQIHGQVVVIVEVYDSAPVQYRVRSGLFIDSVIVPEYLIDCLVRESFINDSKRKEVLNEAIKCVCSDRDKQYGSPEGSFTEIATLWSAYMGIDFTAHDVGMMLALMKVGRIKTGHHKLDNYIDAAGYIACAAECGRA